MEKLFGVPMAGLATGLFLAVLVVAVALTVLAWRNPLVLKLALRSIPRRPAQTVLIVFGLMLSTTIISAALVIGDTVTNSIRGAVLEGLGSTDVRLRSPALAEFGDRYIPEGRVGEVRQALAGDARVDGVMAQVRETLPVTLARTGKTEARTSVVGYDPSSLAGFQGAFLEDGTAIDLARLGAREAVVNVDLARTLDARAGDEVELVTPAGRSRFTVAAIARRGGLASSEPRALVTLPALQAAVGKPGQVTTIEVSSTADGKEGAVLSEELADDLRLKFTDIGAADALFQGLRDAAVVAEIEKQSESTSLPRGLAADLKTLAAELKKTGPSDEFRTQVAKSEVTGAVFAALETAGRGDLVLQLMPAFSRLQVLSVDGIKKRLTDLAELIGNFITTFFTIFGSFSIIVGLLLIFLVFVMLAASRTSEMGIARAVGMKRGHLVQMFTLEGSVYAGVSSLVGTCLGLATSFLLVQLLVRAVGAEAQDDGFTIRYSVQGRSLIAAFSAGLILTFVTVAFSAYRVSKLNIVVAIRGIAQEFAPRERAPFMRRVVGLLAALISPARYFYRALAAVRQGGNAGGQALLGLLSLLIVPWVVFIAAALLRLTSPWLRQGWLTLILGILIANSGIQVKQASLFTIGASFAIIGLALIVKSLLRRFKMRQETEDRTAYTFMGGTLLIFWSLPFDALDWLTGTLDANVEMFILSGVWMVAAATWVITFNADVLLWALDRVLGRSGALRPIIKMAIAYPIAARFRTGLTIAMFALVIFTMMVFAILNNLGNVSRDEPDRVTGGYEIAASIGRDLPVEDISRAVVDSPLLDEADFEVIAARTSLTAEARQPGAEEQRFMRLDVRVHDEQFLTTNLLRVTHYDSAYGDTSREIWDAVAKNASLGLLSQAAVTAAQGGFGDFGGGFKAEGVKATEPGPMTAFDVVLRPPLGRGGDGRTLTVKVIGVVDAFAEQLSQGPGGGDEGGGPPQGSLLYAGPAMRTAFSAQPAPYTEYLFKLRDPAKAADLAPKLETAFLDNSMLAVSTKEEIDRGLQQGQAFNQLFQGFMGLGLIVGVAALGVISFRAVVERRQSIGMQRALGFRANMVRLQFLIESAFVTLLGTGMGLGLGTLISWNIVGDISNEVEGLKFSIPWAQVAGITSIALLFSLMTTWLPARQASRIYPSEALRYE